MKEKSIVVGFWIRVFSDMIDALLLGAVGFLLAIPFGGLFFQLGENGVWIGLIIAFLYSGILQSSIGQGQSIAKKLLKIQVLRLDGAFLSLPQSFLRFVVISMVFYNQWIGEGIVSMVPALFTSEAFRWFYSFVVTVILLGSSFLVALHPLKRGLHDLMVGSIVVRKNAYNADAVAKLQDPSREKRAFIICGIILALMMGSGFLLQEKLGPMKDAIQELMLEARSITQNTQFTKVYPNINVNNFRQSDGSWKKTTVLTVVGFLPKSKFDDDNLRKAQAQKAVDTLVSSYSKISECDYVVVKVRTGYNIGIWSLRMDFGYVFGPDGKELDDTKKVEN